MTAGCCAPLTAGLPLRTEDSLGATGHAPGEREPLPLPRPHGGGWTEAGGWPHRLSMSEGPELAWDYFLFVILIYTAYDTSYINEISPSLPATTSTFESHDQATTKAGSECAPWHSPPSARTRLSCQGQRQTIRTQGWCCWQALPRSQGLRQQVASQFLWAGRHRKDPNSRAATC